MIIINFKIKLLAIFVILIFCLSPLAAVDLDQVNNTKVDNQTVKVVNSTKVDNQTVKVVNSTKVDNQSVKIVNKSVDVEKQKADVKKDVKTLKDERLKPNLQAHIDDVYEDEDIVLTITTDYRLNETVFFTFDDDPLIYKAYLHNGKAKMAIDPNGKMPAGQHTVDLYYLGSSTYDFDEIVITFNVIATKIDSNLDISVVGEPQVGSDVVFKLTADEGFSQDLTVMVYPGSSYLPVKVENGVGETRISELPAGNYTARIIFKGDDTYKPTDKTIRFTVLDKIGPDSSI